MDPFNRIILRFDRFASPVDQSFINLSELKTQIHRDADSLEPMCEAMGFEEFDCTVPGRELERMDESIVSTYNQFKNERGPIALLKRQITAALPSELTLTETLVGKPKKSGSFVFVSVQFAVSDGQTITAFFHSPNSASSSLGADDKVISFRFTVNKQDVTGAIVRTKGKDLPSVKVAAILAKIVADNAPTFAEAKAKRDSQVSELQDLITQIKGGEEEIGVLQTQMADFEDQSKGLSSDLEDLQAALESKQFQLSSLQGQFVTLQANQKTAEQKAAEAPKPEGGEGESPIKGDGPLPEEKVKTTVYNLTTGDEMVYSLSPQKAVVAAFYYAKGDKNWVKWDWSISKISKSGKSVIAGQWSALLDASKPEQATETPQQNQDDFAVEEALFNGEAKKLKALSVEDHQDGSVTEEYRDPQTNKVFLIYLNKRVYPGPRGTHWSWQWATADDQQGKNSGLHQVSKDDARRYAIAEALNALRNHADELAKGYLVHAGITQAYKQLFPGVDFEVSMSFNPNSGFFVRYFATNKEGIRLFSIEQTFDPKEETPNDFISKFRDEMVKRAQANGVTVAVAPLLDPAPPVPTPKPVPTPVATDQTLGSLLKADGWEDDTKSKIGGWIKTLGLTPTVSQKLKVAIKKEKLQLLGENREVLAQSSMSGTTAEAQKAWIDKNILFLQRKVQQKEANEAQGKELSGKAHAMLDPELIKLGWVAEKFGFTLPTPNGAKITLTFGETTTTAIDFNKGGEVVGNVKEVGLIPRLMVNGETLHWLSTFDSNDTPQDAVETAKEITDEAKNAAGLPIEQPAPAANPKPVTPQLNSGADAMVFQKPTPAPGLEPIAAPEPGQPQDTEVEKAKALAQEILDGKHDSLSLTALMDLSDKVFFKEDELEADLVAKLDEYLTKQTKLKAGAAA